MQRLRRYVRVYLDVELLEVILVDDFGITRAAAFLPGEWLPLIERAADELGPGGFVAEALVLSMAKDRVR